MGNLAALLSQSAADVPLWVHFDNAGGQQLTAVLAAPLMAVSGTSYRGLKLVPLLLGLGCLLLIWRIMRREFGLAAALVAALLFALSPPTLVKYSLLASGNHFENLIFWLLAYDLVSVGHRRGAGRLLRIRGRLSGLGGRGALPGRVRAPLAGWVIEGLFRVHEFPLACDVREQLLGSLTVLQAVGPRWKAAALHGYGAQWHAWPAPWWKG